jgi:hypothetical protein
MQHLRHQEFLMAHDGANGLRHHQIALSKILMAQARAINLSLSATNGAGH